MTTPPLTPAAAPADRRETSLMPALWFAVLVTAARLAYLRWVCPYNLVEDEAQYWMWSRYLDWSYYSKGPGVAWAIWLSTRLFGASEWAVRLPTALLMGLGTIAAAGLARDLAARAWEVHGPGQDRARATARRVALYAAIAFALAPALQMVGILMTIDGPYLACWAIAAWAFWRAVERGSGRAWIVLGGAVGLGFLFKYTMLLLLPGLALYAWRRRGKLSLAGAWGGWGWAAAGAAIGAAGLAPVVLWNAQRGWPTVKHLLGHLGVRGGDMPAAPAFGYVEAAERWSPVWPLELIGQQLGIIGPALMLAGVGGLVGWRRAREARRTGGPVDAAWTGQMFLLACAGPILVFYLAVSLITEPEGNWPLAAYATLMPLAGWLAADAVEDKRRALARGEGKPRRTRRIRTLWRCALGYGLVGITMLHFAGAWADGLNALSGTGPFRSAFRELVGREPRPIVVGRLFGAEEMAAQVDRLVDSVGPEAFVITQHYGRASQMAYYLTTKRPLGKRVVEVLCAMAYAGGRRSQFDFWEHTRLDNPALIGRNAVILSNNRQQTLAVWRRLFETVEPIPGASQQLAGEHKPDRVAFIGRGYRGPGTAGGTDAATPKASKDGR